MSIEYSTQRYTLQALPRDLVAHVEQTWLDVHEPTAGMPAVEYWATMAARHDRMAEAYDRLFDALTGGLLTQLTLDARQHHRDQAAQARREHRAQAALESAARPGGEA